MPRPSAPLMTRDEFADLVSRVRVERRNPPAPRAVRDAMALVTEGVVVSAAEGPAEPSLPATGRAEPQVPQPYALSRWVDEGEGWGAANHRLELDIHGVASMTHIDALDHFRWEDRVLPGGELDDLRAGLVTRGVLIDVPGVLGVDVDPGDVITRAEIGETLRRQGVELRRGDALYFRLGRDGARCAHADLAADPMPGLSFECAEWLAEVAPSVVVTDAGLDPNPSEVEGVPVPWHILLLAALGVPLVDMAALGGLCETAARLNRYEFASTIAPLPIPASSGSPVNPLALF
ncbi:cyclase family protein [Microbacterium sp.]|uniref:cyclase family protein n=1 Tax=Microbacterium sp. TaxID=51671 RepID=UPI0028117625|nr:cyclase family protein [Microbacterium sp.]